MKTQREYHRNNESVYNVGCFVLFPILFMRAVYILKLFPQKVGISRLSARVLFVLSSNGGGGAGGCSVVVMMCIQKTGS